MKKNFAHGNFAKIDPPHHIEPLYCTSTVTPNKKQVSNSVPLPPPENAQFAKKCLDENHK